MPVSRPAHRRGDVPTEALRRPHPTSACHDGVHALACVTKRRPAWWWHGVYAHSRVRLCVPATPPGSPCPG